ncbi:MAG TPA: translation elongation factor Ts [Candidatus Campbellbacteria bacterium]|nr:translation elongation factor Ts [Candidatus Campbellbacteria bacterium]
MIASDKIKELRDKTDVSIMVCKKALEKADGDIEKAMLVLREEGVKIAEKKSERALKAGVVESYIHSTKQVGVMVEVRCETDFVARNEEFQKFAHNIAMHIAAANPEDAEELARQDYIKKPEITIEEYVKDNIQKFGENIEISQFARYKV